MRNFSIFPTRWLAVVMLAAVCLSGCGQTPSTPPPETTEVLEQSCQQMRDFLAAAQKSKQLSAVQEELDLKMESLQARSEQFGNQLTELLKAAEELQQKLDSAADMKAAQTLLQEFETRLAPLCPNP